MKNSQEWGPWIEHNRTPCPCVGKYVQVETNRDIQKVTVKGRIINARTFEYIPKKNSPNWDGTARLQVVRYRIRKPKGLSILEGLLDKLPETV